MGLIARNVNIPFEDNEAAADTLTALEADFATIYAEFNGSIANINFKAAANISGSKLNDGTLAGTALENNTVELSAISSSAVCKHGFSTGSGFLLTATSLTDLPNLSSVQLIVGQPSDVICVDVAFHVTHLLSAASENDIVLGWNFNGEEFDNVVTYTEDLSGAVTIPSNPIFSSYMYSPTSPGSYNIKPQYKYAGSQLLVTGTIVFRAWILPGK